MKGVAHLRLMVSVWLVAGLCREVAAADKNEARTLRTLLVTPQQFSPVTQGTQYALSAGGLGCLCTSRGGGYFVSRVELPAGARIHGVEAVFSDSSDDGFGIVSLFRVGESTRDLLALTPMSLAQPLRETASVALKEPEIVREDFQYWLHLTLTGPDVCLRAVRVLYTSD
ncbi:MAG: hypothetical protein KatS3mg077_0518 [Candidatus Binatia bacterium]|nr:MAG: hypothetical protein KatS3mg077_0518 [Candidatus Binatia bacterium]